MLKPILVRSPGGRSGTSLMMEMLSSSKDIAFDRRHPYEVRMLSYFYRLSNVMFLSECGYVRYDYDELRQDPKMHPLNHLDIFYSQSAAWKVGLKEKISLSDFVGSINSNTECQYIE